MAPGTRSALLDAALRRFVAVGIAKTTMEDIAREAGTAKATLYRHYANKAAVVEGVVARETQRFEHSLREAVTDSVGAVERLERAFVTALDFLRRHPLLEKSLREEPGVVLPYLTVPSGMLAESGLRVFGEVVRDGVAAGALRRVDVDWAAETVFRLVLSFLTVPRIAVAVDDPEQVRAYARMLVGGALCADNAQH